MKHNVKSLLVSSIISFLPLFLIDSTYATAFDKPQTSKEGIVDMFEALPIYLQTNSTAENRDFHIKRTERAIGTGVQYYFYFEGGTVTVSMTTNGIFRIGSATFGISGGDVGIGTTTPSTTLQVIGTITATGFSGNGAGLTGITPTFSTVTGSASASQLPSIIEMPGTTTLITGTRTIGRWYNFQNTNRDAIAFGTLTSSSLVSYYQLDALNDSFGTGSLTNYGTTTFVTGKYGNCATFNGTTQYLQANVLSTETTNISMFGWVYIASTSEARAFFNQGVDGADTNGYALGVGNTQMDNAGNNLVGHLHATAWMNFNTAIGTGWHHVGMTRDGTTWRGYIDKAQCATTFTTSPPAPTGNFTIGRNYVDPSNIYFNDKIDDVVFYNKTLSAGEIVELYNNTAPGTHLQYSTQYIPPGTTTAALQIVNNGTNTAKSYLLADVTTAIFGMGTTTDVIGTTTSYAVWADGAYRGTAFNVASTQEIKSNIEDINIRLTSTDAEVKAKAKYIKNKKSDWIKANKNNYTRIGTDTVAYTDVATMKTDYDNYIEAQWASELNQDILIENVQTEYENKFWQTFNSMRPRQWNPKENLSLTRAGFIAEESPPEIRGDDGETIDPMKVIAIQQKVVQRLKTESDKQKLAYQAMMNMIERLGGTITVTP